MSLPFEPPIKPMLSAPAADIPSGDGWLYEPKWDGFRTIVFWNGSECYIQSREARPLGRYFPDLVTGIPPQLSQPCVLDGEVVIATSYGLDFGLLQQRVHPAASRVLRLASKTPARFAAFDLLALSNDDLRTRTFEERRGALESLLERAELPLLLTGATTDVAQAADWFVRFEGAGFDGVMAKRLDQPYAEGERVMVKVKHRRTADCVVGGFRWYKNEADVGVGSLLLGLYDDDGVLHHIGHTSTFTRAQRRELVPLLESYRTDDSTVSFGSGRTPGAVSRWSGDRDTDWVRLRPELVCEVAFDQMQGDRLRHGSTFMRWRTDKAPESCGYDQLVAAVPAEFEEAFGRRR